MKKEIDVKIKKDTSEVGKYDLFINEYSADWFKIENGYVIIGLNEVYREMLDMKDKRYEEYQKLLDTYLVIPPLTEQELVSCIKKHNGDWKVEWLNAEQEKYYFFLDIVSEYETNLLTDCYHSLKENPNSHYMASEEVVQAVIDELGEDRIIEFYKNW